MRFIIDPHDGDVESDASSSKRRSLLSLAGSLLAEISLPKLIVAWFTLIGLPALLVGMIPIAAAIWINLVAQKFGAIFSGVVPALLFIAVAVVGFFGGRKLFRSAERSFWSLNALAVQPVYALCREVLNQIADRMLPTSATPARRANWRAVTIALSGLIICVISMGVFLLAWPHVRFNVELLSLAAPVSLVKAAVANSIALVSAYVAVGALVWSVADATMPMTHDFNQFASPTAGRRSWRVAHLSDIHVVGERYGFRIESGRSGPRGNSQLTRALQKLDEIHATEPVHAILISGDITDAGLATEWAEFFDALSHFPDIAQRILVIPGNHDLNVVSRANPAQFDLPTSPYKRLRKLRVLSAINALQGSRVRVVDRSNRCLGDTVKHALQRYAQSMVEFADTGTSRQNAELGEFWSNVFPMVLPPEQDDGLGIVLLNSNADTHFSFTNALGMVPVEQFFGLKAAIAQYPNAHWIVSTHHHLVEYPRAASAVSERIGTALINGQWFVRQLQSFAGKIVVMHGHRHIDWIGECGAFPIISAPSAVMGDAPGSSTYFYIHTIAVAADGRLELQYPQRIVVEAAAASDLSV